MNCSATEDQTQKSLKGWLDLLAIGVRSQIVDIYAMMGSTDIEGDDQIGGGQVKCVM